MIANKGLLDFTENGPPAAASMLMYLSRGQETGNLFGVALLDLIEIFS